MTQNLPSDPSDSAAPYGPRKDTSSEPSPPTPRAENHPDDSELFIRKTFEADPQKGCELLFRMYYRAMCTHAVRFVYSKEVAEDIVSEIFYNFWNTKAWLAVTTSYRAYLFRSVRNRSYNYLSNDLRKSDPLTDAQQQEESQGESPEQLMQIEELLQTINSLISSLPPQCQKVFLMNRFEGLTSKDIAEELQLSPRTVETHIFKALSVLKNGLKGQWLWVALLVIIS
jgi:RNA polymerase sigma-70 factor (family 1)